MMKEVLLTIIRNKKTDRQNFRLATNQIAYILANEAAQLLPTNLIKIRTEWTQTDGVIFQKNPILIVIWRAGLALLPAFLNYFSQASVGFIGLKREEITAQAKLYYLNLPNIAQDQKIIILDPTLATGGSAQKTLKILEEKGLKQENIIFVSILCSNQGLSKIKQEFPRVTFISCAIDPELNAQKFIVPGFGDFGDRYFGTEP